jgi:hypothetical protein
MSWDEAGGEEQFEFLLDPATEYLSSAPETLPWVVDGVIPSGEITVLFGKSGSMKSFVALDLAIAIATGQPWHGRAVKKSLVVLITPEGARGFSVRLQGACERAGLTEPPMTLQVSQQLVPLNNAEVLRQVLRSVAEANKDPELLEACGYVNDELKQFYKDDPEKLEGLQKKASVVFIIDTLSKCMSRTKFDENSAEDMNGVVRGCDMLKTIGTVILLHHTDKNGHAMRGSYVLDCAAETVIRATETRTGTRLTLEHREGATGEELEFVAEVVPVVRAAQGTTTVRLQLRQQGNDGGSSGKRKSSSSNGARILATLEASGPVGMSAEELKTALGVSLSTIARVRKKLGDEITTAADGRYVLTRLLPSVVTV